MQTPNLWIIGTPLSENELLSEATLDRLEKCTVLVGESRKVAMRWTSKRRGLTEKSWFYLDGMQRGDWRECTEQIQRCKKAGQDVALFSDGGMPILFDPGGDVLSYCREQGFHIRCQPASTSWATACAISGWEPPFLIQGFLPRKTEEREQALHLLGKRKESIVLMETPYRFTALIEQLGKTCTPERAVFLAWEIGTSQERYFWTSVGKIQALAEKQGLQKGEFVLILGAH
jgi:16S rRNA (cytidine1402-2'-O)-methyltransferase